ncbi:MAG: CorA family divalent cation transporter [Calditrichia bacterium]
MPSNRMDEVMRVLTISATIFISLSFLAGVYGMNFDTSASPLNLPEISSQYSYPAFWIVCLLIAGALLIYFRRRKWL